MVIAITGTTIMGIIITITTRVGAGRMAATTTTTIIMAITIIAIIITANIIIVVMGVLIRMPTPMLMLGEDRWAGEDR
jgi:hypothetical protein